MTEFEPDIFPEADMALIEAGFYFVSAGVLRMPNGETVNLTPEECRFLCALASWGRASHKTLAKELGQANHLHPGALAKVLVSRIRGKIGQDSISTIRGYGYEFSAPQRPDDKV